MASKVAERVRRHREDLRAAGLRPIQIWVPDARRPGFADECRRQSAALRDDPHEAATLEWLDAAADRGGWR
jgi:hypothetical protein